MLLTASNYVDTCRQILSNTFPLIIFYIIFGVVLWIDESSGWTPEIFSFEEHHTELLSETSLPPNF